MSTTSNNSKKYDVGVIYVGKTISLPIENVHNKSTVAVDDVVVKLKEVPEGLEFQEGTEMLQRGSYDKYSLIWTIGGMNADEKLTGLLNFIVTDDSKAPFTFNLTLGISDTFSDCDPPNEFCVIVKGLTCTDLKECGFLEIVDGEYDDDADAAANGVEIGKFYVLSADNTYGLPEGGVRKRTS